ncbi:MAG TPA: hypothetical protein VFA34_10155 [Actinomycetota bacterium]|jgi:hypothetical protein|nr:hypothetical protein [Actinomycetota bacterium]
MARKRKRRRQQPTLDGVNIKVERARSHMGFLNDEVTAWRDHQGFLASTVKVQRHGRKHVYLADDPPTVDPMWGAIAGDCVHNLRTALDHLAWQLAKRPGKDTAFPIWRTPRRRWYAPHKHLLPDICGGVGRDVRQALEVVQPYNRRDLNHSLWTISRLDNTDKHRVLLVATSTTRAFITSFSGPPEEQPTRTDHFSRKALEHGQVMGWFEYDPPQADPDPHLRFLPDVAFDRSVPEVGGDLVVPTLIDLIWIMESIVVPEFEKFFS